MPEHSDFDDWVPRTIARELVRIASQCDVVEAEERLIIHMRDLPPDEWRFRLWSAQITVAKEGVRRFPSLSKEVAKAFKFRFWREVDAPRDGARVQVGGNRAAYAGPLLVTASTYTISPPPKGVIVPDSLIVIDEWRQIEARVGDISLRLGPLVSVLRNAGYPVEVALDQLRAQGLLPAAFSMLSSSLVPRTHGPSHSLAKQSDSLEADYAEALNKHVKRPLGGKMKSAWTKEMVERHGWNPGSVQNWLARKEINELWESLGGKPTSEKMRGSRQGG